DLRLKHQDNILLLYFWYYFLYMMDSLCRYFDPSGPFAANLLGTYGSQNHPHFWSTGKIFYVRFRANPLQKNARFVLFRVVLTSLDLTKNVGRPCPPSWILVAWTR